MRYGENREPASPGGGVGPPELPRQGSAQYTPLERLLVLANLEDQKARRETREELQKNTACFSAVIALQHRITTAGLPVEQALDLIADQARQITKAGGAAIALRDGTKVVCRASSGLLAPDLGSELNPESGLSGACLRTGKIQHCEDTETDLRVDMWVCRTLGVRSILAVPIRQRDQIIGILEVFSGWAGVFVERDIRTLRLLAGLVVEAQWTADVQATHPNPPKPDVVETPEVSPARPAESHSSAAPTDILLTAAPAAAIADDTDAAFVEPQAVTAAPIATAEQIAVVPLAAYAAASASTGRRRWVQAIGLAAGILVIVTGSLMWRSGHAAKMPANVSALNAPDLVPVASRETLPPETALGSADIVAGPLPPATVVSIRHWSKTDGTTIGILLNGPVRWDSGELNSPEKIYFDLANAQLPAELQGKAKEGTTIPVNDGLVRRVRVGMNAAGSVRIVIELTAPLEHSAMLAAESYGLMISIPRAGKTAKTATAELSESSPRKVDEAEQGQRAAGPHGLRIVLDPGHGGSEDGAVGHAGLKEKDVVLGIARRLGGLLANRLGAEVIYTRSDDRNVPLEMRAVMANEAGADLFVSVHANYSTDADARGVETYYVDRSTSPVEIAIAARENSSNKGVPPVRVSGKQKLTESHKLAANVQQALYEVVGGEKGVLNRGVKQAPFLVLLDAEMPSILAEVAFVSSPADEQRLTTSQGQEAAAEGLYRGIARYVASSKHDKVVASLGASRGQ